MIKGDEFTDYDITPSFKREVSQACNPPFPIPAYLQLPKPENCVYLICLYQASSQWDTYTYGTPPS